MPDFSQKLLGQAHRRIERYLREVETRRVFPSEQDLRLLAQFDEPLPQQSMSAAEAVRQLEQYGPPNTVASRGGFGWRTAANEVEQSLAAIFRCARQTP
jgi:hypothetical protein